MPRKKLIRSNIHPYHITARCNNREEFHCGKEFAWGVFCYYLNEITELHELKVHSFVMMPNHFHLLLSTPLQDLDLVMHKLMLSVTKTMNSKAGRTGRVFGARYHWSMVSTMGHYDHVQKYIYRNPVKAKIVECVEDYQFSTLKGVLKKGPQSIKLAPVGGKVEMIPNSSQKEYLLWLNQPFRNEEYISIQKGLRKTTFAPTKLKNPLTCKFYKLADT